jgi:uncharacterized protein YdaU (DUF1376 family)
METEPFVKSPAFQVYPADFLADPNTLVMSTVEIGAYWLLILVCWQQNGLPGNVAELSSIARLPLKKFQPLWESHIERCFLRREDGSWTHKRLDKERTKQAENRAKRQSAGLKGASAKWQSYGKAMAMPDQEPNNGHGKAMALDGLSDCSLQSSISTAVEEERPRRRKQKAKPAETLTPDLFPVTDEMREWATGKTPGVDVDVETELFLDKARAKGWTAVDWIAKWHTWMRNAKKFADRDEAEVKPLPTRNVADPAYQEELRRRGGW